MFERLLQSAFDGGGEVFVYMKGFNSPLRGRIQELENGFFTLFQDGRLGTVLWAFRLKDILSCGLLVGPPVHDNAEEEGVYDEVPFNESDN